MCVCVCVCLCVCVYVCVHTCFALCASIMVLNQSSSFVSSMIALFAVATSKFASSSVSPAFAHANLCV